MEIEAINGKPQPNSLEINEALSHVTCSTPFQGSKQCTTLLKYLVEHAQQEGDSSLKERAIGIEIFGRKPDYNTADDPIVRARVGEVRKRLAQYYLSSEAQSSAVQIVIPSGSYRPIFVFRTDANAYKKDGPIEDHAQTVASLGANEHLEPATTTSVPKKSEAHPWRKWAIVILLTCAVLLVAGIGIEKWKKSPLDLFWEPLLASNKPVLIFTGTNSAYVGTTDFINRLVSQHSSSDRELPGAGAESILPPLTEGQVLTEKDVVINRDGMTAIGNVPASVNVAVLLSTHGRGFDMRSGSNLPFVDLHGSSAVLIGSVSSYWTTDMTGSSFFFDRGFRIRERGSQNRSWSDVYGTDGTVTEDYALVTRLLNSKIGGPVIFIAGITSCGTRAASEFVTNPAQQGGLERIPKEAWERKNLEFILHASVVSCDPVSMEIVAVHSW